MTPATRYVWWVRFAHGLSTAGPLAQIACAVWSVLALGYAAWAHSSAGLTWSLAGAVGVVLCEGVRTFAGWLLIRLLDRDDPEGWRVGK